MINNPVLRAIRALCKTGVPHAYSRGKLVLVKDATVVLNPVLCVHGVFSDQLELAETVICIVGAGGGVDDEVLAGGRVDELFWGFVGGEADVEGTAVSFDAISYGALRPA